MLIVAIEKLAKNRTTNPVIRSWEVKRKGSHDYSIVYKVFDTLLKHKIVRAIEPDVDRNEVIFTRNGLHILREEVDYWNRIVDPNYGLLERMRLKALNEYLSELERYFAA
jgi:hypothetical protein